MASPASRQIHIAPTALVHRSAKIGPRTKIWAYSQVAEHAEIGADCVIGNGAYVDRFVRIGDRVRIHNKALLYHGVIVEDDVFIGPAAVFTNDPWPRSGSTRDLTGVSWKIGQGAVIGANVTVLPDVEIGRYAFVGAGSVVTKNVPSYALVYGNPAVLKGYKCPCGQVLSLGSARKRSKQVHCHHCKKDLAVGGSSTRIGRPQ